MSEKQLNMHNPDEAYHYAAWCNRAAINGDTEHARLLEDIGQMTRAEAIAYMEGNHNHDESTLWEYGISTSRTHEEDIVSAHDEMVLYG